MAVARRLDGRTDKDGGTGLTGVRLFSSGIEIEWKGGLMGFLHPRNVIEKTIC
jgi:hypothetical protein